jgi:hypothetical protein
MGKSAPSPPKAPDPVLTAQAQTESNQETARTNAALNRVNQYTPYGSIEYTDLGNDRWKADVALSPDQQQMLDLTNQGKIAYGQTGLNAMDRVRQIMGTRPDFAGLPQINNGVMDRQRVEDALFARMQPKLDAQREALDTRLRNQGLTPGSEAWTRAMREYGMSENDARLATIGAAGSEQQRLFGMSTADRERALRELMAERGIPLNEAAALLGGAQVQYPQFSAVPQTQMQGTDIAGINQNAFNSQMGLYNAQMQEQAGLYGGIAQLGGAAIGAAAMF